MVLLSVVLAVCWLVVLSGAAGSGAECVLSVVLSGAECAAEWC